MDPRKGTGTPARQQNPPPRLKAALAAARRGWPVFPLHPYSTFPAVEDWDNAATTDADAITDIWSQAAYNVGIACRRAGLVVIDLDPARGSPVPPEWAERGVTHGRDVLRILADRAGEPEPVNTYSVITPGKTGPPGTGEHRYFTAPAGVTLRNTAGDRGNGLGWHVDTRADGGFIVATGSVRRVNGRPRLYHVIRDLPVAPLPHWLVTKLTPPPPPPQPRIPLQLPRGTRRDAYVRAAVANEAANVEHAQPGTRADTLFAAAAALGELVGNGLLDEQAAETALLNAAHHHDGVQNWNSAEARRHVRNGLERGKANPRPLNGLTA
ncbi:DNA primase [Amycolatopsis sp. WAC 01375]|uniref:bifunctional DNA primase/polymerase n=1 Tax=Amycolatopsis sp. WAC 01375 TaxID=2203194 RepID=UPI000F7A7270|nr:bifunctional DNA primase/polymerase [Amycolatopsis sp. WAC 01375]RSM68717.1 DNA primase [Amycolatopsis sp. WAC 01375]